jgi:hypothetical protein
LNSENAREMDFDGLREKAIWRDFVAVVAVVAVVALVIIVSPIKMKEIIISGYFAQIVTFFFLKITKYLIAVVKNRNLCKVHLYIMHKFNQLASYILTLLLTTITFYTLVGEIKSVKQRLLLAYQL